MLCALLAAFVWAAPAAAQTITYADGEDRSAPIVLSTDTTQLLVENDDVATQSGPISETGGPRPLERIGTGTLILPYANVFSGDSTLTGGTTELGNLDGLGTGRILFEGGSLRTTVSGTLDNALNWLPGASSVLSAAAGTELTLTGLLVASSINEQYPTLRFGSLSDTGTIVFAQSSVGTFIRNDPGFNTPSGQHRISIEGGTLRLAPGDFAFGFLAGGAAETRVAAGATLDLNGDNATIRNLTGTGTVTSSADMNIGGDFAGSLTGAGGLSVGGHLILTGTNSYSGTTTINGGTLQVGNGGTTGTLGPGDVVINGFTFTSGFDVFRFGTLIFNRSDTISLTNLISGTGDVTFAGPGTVRVGQANSYSGITTLAGGTVELGHLDGLGSGPISFSGGSLLNPISGTLDNDLNWQPTSTSVLSTAAGTELVLTGRFEILGIDEVYPTVRFGSPTESGTIVMASTDQSTLRAISHAGFSTQVSGFRIAIEGGTLRSAAGNAVLGLFTRNVGETRIAAGATLDFNGASGLDARIHNLQGEGTLTNSADTTIDGGHFAGSITGTGGLVERFTGTGLVLTGTNSYSGTTTIEGDTLQIGEGGPTGTLGTGNIVNNGTLVFNRAGTLSVGGAMSGTGALRQEGPGIVILSGAGSFTGGSTLLDGTIELADLDGLGTGEIRFDGGSLRTTVSGTLDNPIVWRPVTGSILSAAAGTEILLGGNFQIASVGSAYPTLRFGSPTDTGTIVVGFSPFLFQTFEGGATPGHQVLAIEGGTVRAASGASSNMLGALTREFGTVRIDAGATLDFNGATGVDARIRNLQGAGTLTNSAVTSVESGEFAGSITGTGGLFKASAGSLLLGGANDYSGTTTIDDGLLFAVGGGAIGDSSAVDIAAGASLVLFGEETIGSLAGAGGVQIAGKLITGSNGTSTIYSGTIADVSSPGALVKTGSGTFTLAGANTYSGGTSILAGTLVQGHPSALGTGPVDLAGGTLDLGAFDLALERVTIGSGSTIQSAGGALFLAGSKTLGSLGGSFTISAPVRIEDGGALTLFGDNIMTGGIEVAGRLNLGSSGAAGGAANTITTTGSVIHYANGVNNTTPIVLSSNDTQLEVSGTDRATQSGTISQTGGSRPLEKIGAGTLVLAAANSYSGASTLSAGTAELANLDGLGSGTIRFSGGSLRSTVSGTLDNNIRWDPVTGSVLSAAAGTELTHNRNFVVDINDGSPMAVRFGSAADTGTVVIASASPTITINGGVSTGSATLAVEGGTVRPAAGNDSLGFLTRFFGQTRIDAGATLDFNGVTGASSTINNLQGAGTLTNSVDTTVRAGNFAGTIAGAGGLAKVTTGTLVLTGANTYSGTTTISEGTLQIGNGGTTGTLGTGNVVNNATLVLNRSDTVTVANTISGTGGVRHEGSGTTILSVANSFTGGTTLLAGTIELANLDGLGTGNRTIRFEGGSLRGAVSGTLDNFINWRPGTASVLSAAAGTELSLSGPFMITSLAGSSPTIRFGSTTDTGTIIVGPSSTSIGFGNGAAIGQEVLAIEGGTVRAGATNGLGFITGLFGTTRIDAGATLDFNGKSGQTIRNLQGAGTLTNSADTGVQAGSFAGTITGTGGLMKTTVGTLVLTGANTYSGVTTISAGTLQIGNGGTTGTLGTGLVVDNGTLVFDRSNALTVANTISGTGAVRQQGSGTLVLAGSNSAAQNFTGTVNVASGHLAIDGSFGDVVGNSASLLVGPGASLGGIGTFFGNVDATQGTLAPGNSPGTLTIGGNLTLGAGTVLNFELAQPGAIGGPLNDLVVVGGNLVLDGTLNTIAFGPGYGPGFYRLFNYGGTLTDNGLALGSIDGGLSANVLTNVAGQVNLRLGGTGAVAIQYWDGTDMSGASATATGDGGSGVWNAANTNWTVPAGYVFNDAWGSQTGIFAGPAGGTVTVEGTQAFQELRFETGGYVLQAGAAGQLATTGGFSLIDVAGGLTADLEVAVSGTGGLTKTGTGTLELSAANSYSGATEILAGTLRTGADLVLTSTSSLTVANGATFDIAGTVQQLGVLSGSGTVLLGNGLLTTGTAPVSSVFAGSILGAGEFARAGSAILTLTGTSDIGRVTVHSGATLSIGSTGSVTAGLVANNGGLSNGGILIGVVANASGAFFGNGGTISGEVRNSGDFGSIGTINGLLVNDAGTSVLALQMNGDVTINGGTVHLAGVTTGIDLVSVGAAGRFDLAGVATSVNGLAGLGAITLGSATLTVGADNSSTGFSGTISGSGGLAKVGQGTLTLAGANSYSGLTLVSGGTLAVAPTGSLAGPVRNDANFINVGSVAGLLDNRGNADNRGTLNDVVNTGTFTNSGRVNGLLDNRADATNRGMLAGVLNTGTFTNSADVTGLLDNRGNAANSGTLAGGAVNSGTLVSTGIIGTSLANSGQVLVQGQLNGAVANDAGTIALTGATTGITQFSQLAGATLDLAGFNLTLGSLSGAGSVQLGSGRLTTGSDGQDRLFAGVISGSGGLTKAGAGALVLTGANTYTGSTIISAGVLQIGNGGTSGELAGASIVDNATLRINRSDALTIASVISGTGAFVQAGTGTTTLAGANSYGGGTFVLAGRLRGSTVSLQGDILDNATLEFAQGSAGTFAGRLFGTGLLEKTGAGRLTLTGDQTGFTGATRVLGDELNVNGLLSRSAVTIGSGAILSGTGVVGGFTAQSGATVAPGNSVGVLGVNGNVRFDPGSTYAAEVTPTGADLILANGTAELAGTLALNVTSGTYLFNSRFLLLQADGGRSGTFTKVTNLGVFGQAFRPEIVYNATQAQLLLAPNQLLAILGSNPGTPNQRSVLAGIDEAVAAGFNPQPLFALFTLDPATQFGAAADALSGEAYGTATRVALEDERLVREATIERLREARDRSASGFALWGQAFHSWGSGDGDANAAGFDRDRTGFVAGLDAGRDYDGGSWRVGLLGHHVETRLAVDQRASRVEIDRSGIGLYAGYDTGPFSVRAGLTYADLDAAGRRDVAFTGFGETEAADYDGDVLQAFGELAWRWRLPVVGRAYVEPFLAASYTKVGFDGFDERGGAARLRIAATDAGLGTLTLGTRGETVLQLGGNGELRLGGSLGALYSTGERQPESRAALVAAPGLPFTIQPAAIDRWSLLGHVEATAALGDSATVSIGYSGLIGADSRDHAVRGTISLRF